MNSEEAAREQLTHQRQQEENRLRSQQKRTQEELETSNTAEVEEEARELMTQQRQQEERLQESMLKRTETEIN